VLSINIPGIEYYNDETEEFGTTKPVSLQLEHSLVSLSKWEAKWRKPFLSKDAKTYDETIDYIRCMTITQNVDPVVYKNLSDEVYSTVNQYIEAPMTATWFSDDKGPGSSREIITAEIIYYWMVSYNIPMECQKWHLNRLLTLIRVCNIKNAPPKKIGKRDSLASRRALNEARRRQLNSKG